MSYKIPKEEVAENRRITANNYDRKRALSPTGISILMSLIDGFDLGISFAEQHYSTLLESLELSFKKINQMSDSGSHLNAVIDMKKIAREALEELSKIKQP